MLYKYNLPDEQGKPVEYETEENAIMMIGGNGSGKSHLGAWIEKNQYSNVHRIAAQRKLSFNQNIQLKSYEEAEKIVFYGQTNNVLDTNKYSRWRNEPTTILIDDFDSVIAAVIALRNNDISKFVNQCNSIENKDNWPDTPETSIDKIKRVWNKVFPQRDIIEEDSKFYAVYKKGEDSFRYPANQMSDGERAVLYLTAQVICVPEGKTLIIDEPELHIHPSIMNRLWVELENIRKDCLFIYITHDLEFVAAHTNVKKYWIKEFNGKNWQYEKLEDENIPEKLTLEILGARKNVLFVEGTKNSYDYQLYNKVFEHYLVIPCESCVQVIERTKAFRKSNNLHEYEVYGLIDRDYRSDIEIRALNKQGIYVLEVAEVENLFLVEELLIFAAKQFAVEDISLSVNKIKDFVIKTKFSKMIKKQICQCCAAEMKYQLSCVEINSKDEEKAIESYKKGVGAIKYEEIEKEKTQIFKAALEKNDYKAVLRVFNEKGIAKSIGHFLGIKDDEYQKKIIALLNGQNSREIIEIISAYIPDNIPRI